MSTRTVRGFKTVGCTAELPRACKPCMCTMLTRTVRGSRRARACRPLPTRCGICVYAQVTNCELINWSARGVCADCSRSAMLE
eukprot:1191530-Prorocentrum_minimum.AAC.8